jgi:hypothetical protein
VPSPVGRRLSATALQTWASCGFRYFLGQVLGLGERLDPEAVVEISPADRGSLVHEILERFIDQAIRRPGGPPLPEEPWSADDAERLQAIAGDLFVETEAKGTTGRPLRWRLQQQFVRGDLDAFLAADSELRAELGTRPAHAELAFGFDESPPLTIDLGPGRRLAFRGKIDRVDQTADGSHVVYDYKTGRGDHYRGLDADPVLEGTTLQLGLYAEAVRHRLGADRVHSSYWMVSDAGGFKRRGYEWTADRRARFVDVVAAITDGIEAGTFPMRSGPYNLFFRQHDNCRHCAFDSLCPRDRDDQELAKQGAPELAVRARLRPPGEAST